MRKFDPSLICNQIKKTKVIDNSYRGLFIKFIVDQQKVKKGIKKPNVNNEENIVLKPYDPKDNNCQTFVTDFLKAFDLESNDLYFEYDWAINHIRKMTVPPIPIVKDKPPKDSWCGVTKVAHSGIYSKRRTKYDFKHSKIGFIQSKVL